MGLLLDAAKVWDSLHNTYYIMDVARKGKLQRIELSFSSEDFSHLAGMQYAQDVDFGIRKSLYYGERLIPALLSGQMNDEKIENSRNWEKISGRLSAIINLTKTLDGQFVIVSFNNTRVKGYCKIAAKYAIKNVISGDMYFLFIDERSGQYYFKSAFKKEDVDYTENQPVLTMLQKIKVIDNARSVLYSREGYQPEDIV